jgi:hypothetical protein
VSFYRRARRPGGRKVFLVLPVRPVHFGTTAISRKTRISPELLALL